MANYCKAFQALPDAGGVNDQDPRLLEGIALVWYWQEKTKPKPNPKG